MDEQHFRVETGVSCLQCEGDIFECRVVESEWVIDHWYACQCGCACVDCRKPMTFVEKDTSSGTEYRTFRCPGCGREGNVRAGIAMWAALQGEEATLGWLAYDDFNGRRVVRLTEGEWVIGRDPGSDIVVRDFGCSRRHAMLVVEIDGVRIVDLKSKGGTQVGQRSVTEARLASGDEVRLGTMLFQFVAGPTPPAHTTAGPVDLGPPPRPGLAALTAALERPPGSLREDTRLRELGGTLHSLMYAVYRVSEAFHVELPRDRLLLINTVGELLDLIEDARRPGPD
jgi:acyl carrier protein